eukprot:m.47134 g.47134  ORF g.47134 m.47134 type:complete len:715 (-) comp7312_c2_seq1:206-2350(-)
MGTGASQPLSEATLNTYKVRPSRFGVPEARVLRLQKDLEAATNSMKALRRKIARLEKDKDKLQQTNNQLVAAKEGLVQELDKLRCIADQHRRDDSEVEIPIKRVKGGDLFHRPGVVDVQTNEILNNIRAEKMDGVTRSLLMEALQNNPYTSKLTLGQQRCVISAMTPIKFKPDEVIIEEGAHGEDLYIIASGVVHVTNLLGDVNNDIRSGQVFGELALIYDCTRTATVIAKTAITLYKIDRNTFKFVTKQAKIDEFGRLRQLFKQMPLLQDLSEKYIADIVANAREVMFLSGQTIVEQGQQGDVFYLITDGEVEVLQDKVVIRNLFKGDHFGEGALLEAYNIRTATCKAISEVTCATLNRETFIKYIIPLEALGRLSYLDVNLEDDPLSTTELFAEFNSITLNDLEQTCILGVGGFGQVSLVHHRNTSKYFALKSIAKAHIIETGQEEYVVCEKKVMRALNTPFCAPLYHTYKDSRFIYLLSEALLGGELWRHLRQAGHFMEERARFYIGCVVEAIAYLHNQSIIYRDLKPENVLMDRKGYVKLVDFGFARRLPRNAKTWTFCGTPEYMAPEIVMNQGHDRGVDYWALGVLVYELMSGHTPFACQDAMDTYNLIILGIDHVKFHRNVTSDGRDLILSLCRENSFDRLGQGKNGVKSIKNHRWFKSFDWDKLQDQIMPAPFLPKLQNDADCRYFDSLEPRELPPEIGACDWDNEF